jgi:hypothetical protein
MQQPLKVTGLRVMSVGADLLINCWILVRIYPTALEMLTQFNVTDTISL